MANKTWILVLSSLLCSCGIVEESPAVSNDSNSAQSQPEVPSDLVGVYEVVQQEYLGFSFSPEHYDFNFAEITQNGDFITRWDHFEIHIDSVFDPEFASCDEGVSFRSHPHPDSEIRYRCIRFEKEDNSLVVVGVGEKAVDVRRTVYRKSSPQELLEKLKEHEEHWNEILRLLPGEWMLSRENLRSDFDFYAHFRFTADPSRYFYGRAVFFDDRGDEMFSGQISLRNSKEISFPMVPEEDRFGGFGPVLPVEGRIFMRERYFRLETSEGLHLHYYRVLD